LLLQLVKLAALRRIKPSLPLLLLPLRQQRQAWQ
jgi:hypothetical protein